MPRTWFLSLIPLRPYRRLKDPVPTVGKKMQVCTLIHANLESRITSLQVIVSGGKILLFYLCYCLCDFQCSLYVCVSLSLSLSLSLLFLFLSLLATLFGPFVHWRRHLLTWFPLSFLSRCGLAKSRVFIRTYELGSSGWRNHRHINIVFRVV